MEAGQPPKNSVMSHFYDQILQRLLINPAQYPETVLVGVPHLFSTVLLAAIQTDPHPLTKLGHVEKA
ncbi:unnamed protein product [Ambrosiozyma monospora]|uniref:Unnamed protein product n=1 Tax=Ambrosiozyma monospora TaxID=43982 RepID=A0A9W6T9U1_AMBMO|nr:unnamed protein product [Ambrosiozyma monospora]